MKNRNCITVLVRKSSEVGSVTSFIVNDALFDPQNPHTGIVFPTTALQNDNAITIFFDGILYSDFNGTDWVPTRFVPTLNSLCNPAGPYMSFSEAGQDNDLADCAPYFLAKINDERIPVSGTAIGPIFFKKQLV